MTIEAAIDSMKLSDWLMIGATVIGPIAAVQAQKWVERWREKTQRKNWVFATLMSTRNARTSPLHVGALNSIELAFYRGRFAILQATGADAFVLDRWHEYYEHLNTPQPNNDDPQARQFAQGIWNSKSQELFINLLEALATATGYSLTRQQIQDGHYSPIAHETNEQIKQALDRGLLEMLYGQRNLGVDVKSIHASPEQVAQQKKFQEEVISGLNERRAPPEAGPPMAAIVEPR